MQIKQIQINSSNWKSIVDKLDVNKLVTVPAGLSKLSDAVNNDVVKKNRYNAKVENIEDKNLITQLLLLLLMQK